MVSLEAKLASLVYTLTETLRYRGALGQWSWVLHRLTGVGVVFFLFLHVIDTSWAVFYPEKYVEAIAVYQSPLFTLGEFGLVAAVVYHAINGLRISILDNRPNLWRYQQRAAIVVLGICALILIPVFILMFGHVLDHYGEGPAQLPLTFVLQEQIPFIVGLLVALVASIFFSVIYSVIAGDTRSKPRVRDRQGSKIERFWWSYMRVSGLLIVPLVFGHLALVHVIQGVFDITTQGALVTGTSAVNASGTAVEFVAQRWNTLIAGVAIWRLYDFALLALVTVHGFNGLRYVLTDYTMNNAILRRAMIYLCVIGAVVLLVMGTGALLGTIDQAAIEMAEEAMARMHP
jgi:succinate dehydrogenase / fumarate reductase cytochrome b subunit